MGIVIREWRCGDCGSVFESSDSPDDVECPSCSAQEPERVFLTPPAIKSPQTTRKDEITKDLASAYGLSNMSNANGEPVKRPAPQPQEAPQFAAPTLQVLNGIKPEFRDSFSPFSGKLKGPNATLAAAGFPFHKRQNLAK